jgi:hypothetical protein
LAQVKVDGGHEDSLFLNVQNLIKNKAKDVKTRFGH